MSGQSLTTESNERSVRVRGVLLWRILRPGIAVRAVLRRFADNATHLQRYRGPEGSFHPGLFLFPATDPSRLTLNEDLRMKSSVRLFTITVVALLASAVAVFAQTSSPVGQWDAVVTVSNNTIEIPFRFEIVSSGGTYRGYFFDGDVKVPSQPGTFENGALDLRFDQYGTRLQATLTGDRLDGQYDAARAARHIRSGRFAPVRPKPTTRSSRHRRPWNIPMEELERRSRVAADRAPERAPKSSAAILRIDGDTGTLTGRYTTASSSSATSPARGRCGSKSRRTQTARWKSCRTATEADRVQAPDQRAKECRTDRPDAVHA